MNGVVNEGVKRLIEFEGFFRVGYKCRENDFMPLESFKASFEVGKKRIDI